jgi:hypothetical protein
MSSFLPQKYYESDEDDDELCPLLKPYFIPYPRTDRDGVRELEDKNRELLEYIPVHEKGMLKGGCDLDDFVCKLHNSSSNNQITCSRIL